MQDIIDVQATIVEEVESVDLVVQPIKQAEVVTNIEDVKKYIEQSISKYQDYVVDEINLPTALEDEKKLKGLIKTFDDQRKVIKKEMETPIKEMENQFKEIINLIKPIVEKITEQTSVYAQEELKERKTKFYNLIKPMFDSLEEKYIKLFVYEEKYYNKGSFTATGQLTKTIKDLVVAQIESLKVQQDVFNNDIQGIKNLVASKNATNPMFNISDEMFIYLYEQGKTFSELIPLVEEEVTKQLETIEILRIQAEENALKKVDNGTLEAVQQTFGTLGYNHIKQEEQRMQTQSDTNPATNNDVWEIHFNIEGTFSQVLDLNEYIKSSGLKKEVTKRIKNGVEV
ncbi:MAG: DUF1351 domain-containing protein [Oscillospiraceae bacterium]